MVRTLPFEYTPAALRHTVGIPTEVLNYVGTEAVSAVPAVREHRRGYVSERTDLIDAARHARREAVGR